MNCRILIPLFTFLLPLSPPPAISESDPADLAWKTIENLEKSPKIQPSDSTNATSIAAKHLATQRQIIENFLTKHPLDERAPLAELKLAEILAAQGFLLSKNPPINQALAILSKLESHPTATSRIKTTAAFRRASIFIQTLPGTPEQNFRKIAAAASRFASRFPNDPRAAPLLVEAATVCDASPSLKRQLLKQALYLAHEQPLVLRIRDDLHRLNLLGKSTKVEMPELHSRKKFQIHSQCQPAIIIFWSPQSQPSLLWLEEFQKQWESLQNVSYSIITVAVSENRSTVLRTASRFPKNWQTFHEPGGWESPTIRSLGINSLPSVWILDSQSTLRSINAKSTWQSWIKKLAKNK